eukprot:COSAG05_NODE_102_length_19076_cov_21.766612_2_plen_224_part_00
MPNSSAPLRAMAGAAAEVLNGVGDEQVRRWRIWRAGAICCSRGGLQRRSGRLPDIMETARPSPGVFWPRQVGVSGLRNHVWRLSMSKVSSGCRRSHYHINHKTSNTLAGSALPLPPLTRSGRSSNPFQSTDRHNVTPTAPYALYASRGGGPGGLTIIAILDLLGGAAQCMVAAGPMHGIQLPATDACRCIALYGGLCSIQKLTWEPRPRTRTCMKSSVWSDWV